MTKIAFSSFVRRQTPESSFSYSSLPDDVVIRRVVKNFDRATPGYREGVALVPVDPDGFFSGVVRMTEGDTLSGRFAARRPGEDPRKQVGVVGGRKIPARSVQIVLYRSDVLAEDGSRTTDADWEIVSINASAHERGAEPLSPETLMTNHFHVAGSNDGGTSTGMSDAEFVAALRESYEYWRDKANVAV